eukprot:7387903-Prymnesium_polylepis.2
MASFNGPSAATQLCGHWSPPTRRGRAAAADTVASSPLWRVCVRCVACCGGACSVRTRNSAPPAGACAAGGRSLMGGRRARGWLWTGSAQRPCARCVGRPPTRSGAAETGDHGGVERLFSRSQKL